MLLGIRKVDKKEKKAVSLMIGYVLLVTLAIIMGVVAYSWMKTYLPREANQCPDGASLFIKEAEFDNETSQLILTLKNNGRFNILGYYIYATNISGQEVATIELSNYLLESFGGEKLGNSVSFASGGDNSFVAGEEATHFFDIPEEVGTIYSVSVTPTRIETEENKERFTVCSSLGVRGNVGEILVPGQCVPTDTCGSLGYTQCNPPGWDGSDGCTIGVLTCGDNSGSCLSGEFCDTSGECGPPPATCGDGDLNQPPEQCDNGELQNGVECTPSYGSSCDYCSSLCQNVTIQGPYCGDGIKTSPTEACDDGDSNSGDGCSSTCQIESGWSCADDPTPPPASVCSESGGGGAASCINYCTSLNLGYTGSSCQGTPGQCVSQESDYKAGGNQECVDTGAPVGSRCCCFPSVA